jgi:hypothetical protein
MSDEERLDLAAKLRDLILISINEHTKDGVVHANLDSVAARENLACFIASYLSPQVEEYEEEIRSLWFMLDELNNAENALKSPEFQNEISDMVKTQMAYLKMMQNQKGDA